MADFVRYVLDDGSEVVFETAEGGLVEQLSGEPDVAEGGLLRSKLAGLASAVDAISSTVRSQLAPDELELEFGIKVGGEISWWFFAKNQAESTVRVTARWRQSATSGGCDSSPTPGAGI